MKATAALLLAVLIVLPSCGEPITGSRGSFSVRAKDDHLVLTNQLSEPAHYVAMDEEVALNVDFIHPSKWPALPAGGKKEIPYDDVILYTPSTERVVVSWWTESEGNLEHLLIDL